MAIVPPIVRRKLDLAAQMIHDAGLVVGEVTVNPAYKLSATVVLNVHPHMGTTVPEGSAVALDVSDVIA